MTSTVPVDARLQPRPLATWRPWASVGFWQTAGALKANLRRVSLADCFAMTLAQAAGGSVLTSDHREFDSISAAGVCRVEFIR